MAELGALLVDLAAEGEDLDVIVSGLSTVRWRSGTPAVGWTVAHQIAHLAWTDEVALLAATDADGFAAQRAAALPRAATFVDEEAARGATATPTELLTRWRTGRSRLIGALAMVTADAKLPWFGPGMSATSMATARLMETWAHGQDVADALEVRREPTDRLRHVAHIGVRTRDFAYLLRDRQPPAEQFRVELTGPSGDLWTWGPQDSPQRVTGSAPDFCLLVTQRVNRADTDLVAAGADASEWLNIAQAFAGPPGGGRAARAAS